MNWIIKFNQLEKENTDKTLDILGKYDKYKYELLDEVYIKAHNLKYSIGKLIDKLNINAIVGDPLKEEVEKLVKEYIQMKDDYENSRDKMKEYMYVCGSEAAQLKCTMIQIVSRFISAKKDLLMFNRRMDAFTKKLINMYSEFDMGSMGEIEVLQDVYWDLITIKDIIDTRNKEYDERVELLEKLKKNQKKDYFKIFDYKEMIDLAEKNEYKQVRQSGDHIIMQHNKTNKIVPIPAHELKYGLMIQIQKQIHANKAS